MSGIELVAERPVPGHPRAYDFPATIRTRLANGLRVIVTPMPGRALIAASLVIRAGAGDEPADRGGATVLGARALTEGTEVRDAIALTEATERLGASLHAEAGWDATFAGLDVPASRLAPALELLAEVLRRPAFPEREVDRLRDERLTDLLQAKADPRRRAEEAFVDAIYAPSSPYHRPSGGSAETVATLTAAELQDRLRAEHRPCPGRDRRRGRRGAGRRDRRRRGPVRRLVAECDRRRPRPDRRHVRRHRAVRQRRPPARAPSRRRSASGTRRCHAATRTSTPCP